MSHTFGLRCVFHPEALFLGLLIQYRDAADMWSLAIWPYSNFIRYGNITSSSRGLLVDENGGGPTGTEGVD